MDWGSFSVGVGSTLLLFGLFVLLLSVIAGRALDRFEWHAFDE